MLWLFDTGRMAKKFGKWRGVVTVAHAVCICAIAVAVSYLADVVVNLDTTPVGASKVALTALVIYGAGVLLGIWGACQYLADATRGTYISDAERYDRQRL